MVRWMDDGLRTIPREGKEHMDQSANSFIHSPPSQSYAQKLSVCLIREGLGDHMNPKCWHCQRGGALPLAWIFLENLSTMHCNAVRALQSAHLSPKSDKLPQTISLW